MTTINKQYAPFFKAWPVKQLGEKPSEAMLATVHGLGLRPGKQALANAMALRAEGVSGAQIVMACGAPQLNRMRDLIKRGYVKRNAAPANAHGHTVYQLTLTPRGEAYIDRAAKVAETAAVDGEAKPAKKATPRKRPAKGKGAVKAPPATEAPATVETPTSEAPAQA